MNLKECRQILALVSLLVFLPVLAFSQTASEMDSMLQTDTVSSAQAAHFILGSADLLPSEKGVNHGFRIWIKFKNLLFFGIYLLTEAEKSVE